MADVTLRKLGRWVPVAVGLSLLVLIGMSVYYQTQKGVNIIAEIKLLDARVIPIALGLHVLAQACWAHRYLVLGRGLGIPLRYGTAQAVVTGGLFAAGVTPARLAGEPTRLALLVRGGVSADRASRVVLADRAVDLLYFILLGVGATFAMPLLFSSDTSFVQGMARVGILLLALVLILAVLSLTRPKAIARSAASMAAVVDRMRRRPVLARHDLIEHFLTSVTRGLVSLVREQPWRVAAAAVFSILLWSCEFMILWVLLRGFGYDVGYLPVYVAGLLIFLMEAIPLGPGGTGLAEAAALLLLTPLAEGLSPAFVIVWRGLTYYYDLLVGGILLFITWKRRTVISSTERELLQPA